MVEKAKNKLINIYESQYFIPDARERYSRVNEIAYEKRMWLVRIKRNHEIEQKKL